MRHIFAWKKGRFDQGRSLRIPEALRKMFVPHMSPFIRDSLGNLGVGSLLVFSFTARRMLKRGEIPWIKMRKEKCKEQKKVSRLFISRLFQALKHILSRWNTPAVFALGTEKKLEGGRWMEKECFEHWPYLHSRPKPGLRHSNIDRIAFSSASLSLSLSHATKRMHALKDIWFSCSYPKECPCRFFPGLM